MSWWLIVAVTVLVIFGLLAGWTLWGLRSCSLTNKAPALPKHPCMVLMAEIVDDYTNLALQGERYLVRFDPGNLSIDGSHYNFGVGYGRASGWRPLSRSFGEYGFYVASVL